jgi:spore germination protein KC
MDVAPPLERVPALYLLAMLQKANDMGKFPADFVGEFWSSESKLGQEGYLPFVSIRQKENILLKGLAYFKDSKMVGHTNALEIGVFMGIMGYNPGGYSPLVEVPDIGVVILNVLRRDTKRQIKMIDGEPHVFLNIKMETSIDEVLSEATIDSESKLKKVEEEFKHTSYDAFENLIRRTQKVNSDIFGFGELIRAHERSYWNEHVKSESDWERLYGELPITTTVKVVVRRIGLTE